MIVGYTLMLSLFTIISAHPLQLKRGITDQSLDQILYADEGIFPDKRTLASLNTKKYLLSLIVLIDILFGIFFMWKFFIQGYTPRERKKMSIMIGNLSDNEDTSYKKEKVPVSILTVEKSGCQKSANTRKQGSVKEKRSKKATVDKVVVMKRSENSECSLKSLPKEAKDKKNKILWMRSSVEGIKDAVVADFLNRGDSAPAEDDTAVGEPSSESLDLAEEKSCEKRESRQSSYGRRGEGDAKRTTLLENKEKERVDNFGSKIYNSEEFERTGEGSEDYGWKVADKAAIRSPPDEDLQNDYAPDTKTIHKPPRSKKYWRKVFSRSSKKKDLNEQSLTESEVGQLENKAEEKAEKKRAEVGRLEEEEERELSEFNDERTRTWRDAGLDAIGSEGSDSWERALAEIRRWNELAEKKMRRLEDAGPGESSRKEAEVAAAVLERSRGTLAWAFAVEKRIQQGPPCRHPPYSPPSPLKKV